MECMVTTVVYKDGKLYADRRASHYNDDGEFLYFDQITKIHIIGKRVFSGAGSVYVINIFKNRFHLFFGKTFGFTFCFLNKYILQNSPASNVFVYENDIVNVYGAECKKIIGNFSVILLDIKAKQNIKDSEWLAFGSGKNAAARELRVSDNPYKAMIRASKEDVYTNNNIQVVDLETLSDKF
jgi:hypothetical protein